MQTADDRSQRIRELNDALRQDPSKGKLMITDDIASLAYQRGLAEILTAVRNDADFTEDNDPYGEHDFGKVEIGNEVVWWKIDYYAPSLDAGSEDPSDTTQTTRVMTIMTPSEY